MQQQGFQQGTFFVGCNYWASHAGMRMWSQWNEQIVEDDLRRLSENRICTLRVFPLWSDFQPLRMHCGGGGTPVEVRMGEQPLPDTEAGKAGVDETMLERFGRFCDLAEKYGIRLVVGLLTGWMSGRLFVPEMLQGRNVMTDALAMKWEIKFVRLMVRRFREHPAIMAWDLGNECNCMGPLENSEQAYVWASTISMAIRVEDAAHPIVSGMHSLSPNGTWRMQDQGEFLDVLCTHPYPLFTPHCDTDPLNQMKSALHATAESLYYAGIGGKPCFAEETGVLGPMMISDEYAADYVRAALHTLLAHDCRGMMWWCANEQSALTLTPYDWHAVERELGLFYLDKRKKPVLEEMTRFANFVDRLPVYPLPQRITDAVCLLTPGQDCWAAAYGAFLLAKQAGLDLSFAWINDPLPDARVYLLPSLNGYSPLTRRAQAELMQRVQNGAILYLSLDGAMVSPFAELTGLRVLTRAHAPSTRTLEIGGEKLSLQSDFTIRTESVGAQILMHADDGNPVLSKFQMGKGCVYTLLSPIEKTMAVLPGMTDSETAQPLYRFYQVMNLRSGEKCAAVDLPTVGLTEHVVDDDTRLIIAINYEPFPQSVSLTLKNGWHATDCISEDDSAKLQNGRLSLSHNSGAVLTLSRK